MIVQGPGPAEDAEESAQHSSVSLNMPHSQWVAESRSTAAVHSPLSKWSGITSPAAASATTAAARVSREGEASRAEAGMPAGAPVGARRTRSRNVHLAMSQDKDKD